MLSEKGLHGGLLLKWEILFILRLLIYMLFTRKYGSWSWILWLVSLTVNLVGEDSSSQATKLHRGRNTQKVIHLPVPEKDEVMVLKFPVIFADYR